MPSDWLVSWAAVIGPLGTLLLALVAMLTAWAAWISAKTARKEFQVARRPFPYIRWDDARLTEIVTLDGTDGPGPAALIVSGRVHEASSVPTTLHRARMRLRVGPREVSHVEEAGPFQDLLVGDGALLFGEHMYYILHEARPGLTINRAEYEDFARRRVPIIVVETELVVSGPEQLRETWRIAAELIHSQDEKDGVILSARQSPPIRIH